VEQGQASSQRIRCPSESCVPGCPGCRDAQQVTSCPTVSCSRRARSGTCSGESSGFPGGYVPPEHSLVTEDHGNLRQKLVGPVRRAESAHRRLPSVGTSSPHIILMVVVLPAPFGPSRPTISPAATDRSRPRTASTVTVRDGSGRAWHPADRPACCRNRTISSGPGT